MAPPPPFPKWSLHETTPEFSEGCGPVDQKKSRPVRCPPNYNFRRRGRRFVPGGGQKKQGPQAAAPEGGGTPAVNQKDIIESWHSSKSAGRQLDVYIGRFLLGRAMNRLLNRVNRRVKH